MKTTTDPRPPKISKSWNGHSRKGQAQYDAMFEYEKEMADKHDPVPDSEPGDMYYGL